MLFWDKNICQLFYEKKMPIFFHLRWLRSWKESKGDITVKVYSIYRHLRHFFSNLFFSKPCHLLKNKHTRKIKTVLFSENFEDFSWSYLFKNWIDWTHDFSLWTFFAFLLLMGVRWGTNDMLWKLHSASLWNGNECLRYEKSLWSFFIIRVFLFYNVIKPRYF